MRVIWVSMVARDAALRYRFAMGLFHDNDTDELTVAPCVVASSALWSLWKPFVK